MSECRDWGRNQEPVDWESNSWATTLPCNWLLKLHTSPTHHWFPSCYTSSCTVSHWFELLTPEETRLTPNSMEMSPVVPHSGNRKWSDKPFGCCLYICLLLCHMHLTSSCEYQTKCHYWYGILCSKMIVMIVFFVWEIKKSDNKKRAEYSIKTIRWLACIVSAVKCQFFFFFPAATNALSLFLDTAVRLTFKICQKNEKKKKPVDKRVLWKKKKNKAQSKKWAFQLAPSQRLTKITSNNNIFLFFRGGGGE